MCGDKPWAQADRKTVSMLYLSLGTEGGAPESLFLFNYIHVIYIQTGRGVVVAWLLFKVADAVEVFQFLLIVEVSVGHLFDIITSVGWNNQFFCFWFSMIVSYGIKMTKR